MSYNSNSRRRWLAARLNVLGSLIDFGVILMLLYLKTGLRADIAALVFSLSLQASDAFTWIVRLGAQVSAHEFPGKRAVEVPPTLLFGRLIVVSVNRLRTPLSRLREFWITPKQNRKPLGSFAMTTWKIGRLEAAFGSRITQRDIRRTWISSSSGSTLKLGPPRKWALLGAQGLGRALWHWLYSVSSKRQRAK